MLSTSSTETAALTTPRSPIRPRRSPPGPRGYESDMTGIQWPSPLSSPKAPCSTPSSSLTIYGSTRSIHASRRITAKSSRPAGPSRTNWTPKAWPCSSGIWGNIFDSGSPTTRRLRNLTGGTANFAGKTVDSRAKTVLQLQATLKMYFPQAMAICGRLDTNYALTLLSKWPSLKEMQRANPDLLRDFLKKTGRSSKATLDKLINDIRAMRPLTTNASIIEPYVMYVQDLVERIKLFNKKIEEYERELNKTFASHEDASLFKSSSPVPARHLRPRLAVAFGTDRDRFQDASELQELSGIAPVTEQSGQSRWVHRRWTCRKFLLQTFHEFADPRAEVESTSREGYQAQRGRPQVGRSSGSGLSSGCGKHMNHTTKPATSHNSKKDEAPSRIC